MESSQLLLQHLITWPFRNKKVIHFSTRPDLHSTTIVEKNMTSSLSSVLTTTYYLPHLTSARPANIHQSARPARVLNYTVSPAQLSNWSTAKVTRQNLPAIKYSNYSASIDFVLFHLQCQCEFLYKSYIKKVYQSNPVYRSSGNVKSDFWKFNKTPFSNFNQFNNCFETSMVYIVIELKSKKKLHFGKDPMSVRKSIIHHI